jgi:hypothetical protein
MRYISFIAIVFLIFFISCEKEPQEYMSDCGLYNKDYLYNLDYEVNIDSKTPEGIPVDSGGIYYDLTHIDEMSNDVRDCLIRNFPDLILPEEVLNKTYCTQLKGDKKGDFSKSYNAAWGYSFGCWQVKIDNNWVLSCDGKQQLLSAIAPTPIGKPCGGKEDMITSKECPCRYRVAIMGKTIVVPPDARLFKDGLIRVITGCNNPWAHPLLSECASPEK